jgi:hypothetical protein
MPPTTPLPRAYRGRNHETIGSDILALHQALQLPELLLGAEVARVIAELDPAGWYPIRRFLEPLEVIGESVGPSGLRKVGRTLFQRSHQAHVQKTMRCAKELLYALDDLYHRANRGEGIGGWRVVRFADREAELEKTTPHHCALEEGILDAAMRAVGAPARIEQPSCVRDGAPACRFLLTAASHDGRWLPAS